jgi:hypothetical protein
MSGSSQGNFSQLTKLPSATAESDAQVGLGTCLPAGSFLPPTEASGGQAFTKPSLSGHFLYTGR